LPDRFNPQAIAIAAELAESEVTSMITTVTLNASIDKAYRINMPLTRRTVMRVAECEDSAGGKGLNAARAIAACGEPVVATGFVGGNNGRYLCELVARDGIRERFVRVKNETRCCINVLEPGGGSTEFLEPGRPVYEAELEEMKGTLLELAKQSDVVTMSGSTPAGASSDVYQQLVRLVRETGKPVILDTSGDFLMKGIHALPTMLKPNIDEIGQLLGRKIDGIDEVVSAAQELHERGVEIVVVSLGAAGAIMACDEGVFHGNAPKIQAVNPVGAGDTMVGSFAVAIARGMKGSERLRFAMSCASASCLSPHTGRFDPQVADDLFNKTAVESVA
jgi:tagatose 6-phosphate kinase